MRLKTDKCVLLMYLGRKEWREEVLDLCNALLKIIPKVGYKKAFFHVLTALVGLGLLEEAAQSHSDRPQSVGFVWTGDQPIGNTST